MNLRFSLFIALVAIIAKSLLPVHQSGILLIEENSVKNIYSDEKALVSDSFYTEIR